MEGARDGKHASVKRQENRDATCTCAPIIEPVSHGGLLMHKGNSLATLGLGLSDG